MTSTDPRTYQMYGSSLTLGTFANRYDRAISHGIERELVLANPDALKDAILSGVADQGNYHPQWPSLPMQTMTATRFGPTKALMTAAYWRSTVGSLPHPPGQPQAYMVDGFWSTNWVRDSSAWWNAPIIIGYPKGQIPGIYSPFGSAVNPELKPMPRPRERTLPVIELYVPTVLNYNPFGVVGHALDKVNKFSLSFGGVTILPGRIRFDALNVIPETSNQTGGIGTPPVFNVTYKFTLSAGGFWYEDVYFGSGLLTDDDFAYGSYPSNPDTSVSGDRWRTRVLPAHEWIKFPTFPAG